MRQIPQMWESTQGRAVGPDGSDIIVRSWGWSTTSRDEARQMAQQRLPQVIEQAAQEFGHGGYYPRAVLREELLEEVHDDSGSLIAAVTRNRYGAEVLSVDAVLIADVDLPQRSSPTSTGMWGRLFGGGRSGTSAADHEGEALQRLGAFAGDHPEWGTHVYRTAGGLRVLVTGTNARPGAAKATQILQAMDSDPLYVELCTTHETYRARLTPKPWRIGMGALRTDWPTERPSGDDLRQRWVSRYDTASAGRASCERVASFGAAADATEQRLLDLHDMRGKADSGLPLA